MSRSFLSVLISLILASVVSAQTTGPKAPAPQAMSKWAGKYPDTKFFNQPQIKNPLRQLLSKEDYDSIANYNLMTPIEKVGDYLVTNASIKYSMPDEILNVAFSLKDGAVYVVFWKGEEHRKFSTKDNQFNLPDEVLKELRLKEA
jgi:hypothetical protein